jgi:hypothetical protein
MFLHGKHAPITELLALKRKQRLQKQKPKRLEILLFKPVIKQVFVLFRLNAHAFVDEMGSIDVEQVQILVLIPQAGPLYRQLARFLRMSVCYKKY